MKVIHLISGGDTGGAKTHVHSLLRSLSGRMDLTLVCFTGGEFADEAAALGIHTVVMDGGVADSLRRLRRLIRREGFQLVHCHGSRGNMMGVLLKPLIGVPVISTVHSDYKLDYLGRPLAALTYGKINAFSLHRMDALVGVSDFMRELLISRGFDARRVFAIYNGLDFDRPVQQLSRAEYFAARGIPYEPGDVVVGIAARLDPVKDVATLLRGFAAALDSAPQLRLVVAGDGAQREMLGALAVELGAAERIHFVGWETDMDSFYHALDINTLTSLSETFPYALTEGALHSLPTVASRVGGVPYLIGHEKTGLLFEAGDSGALGAHLARLGGDAALRGALGGALHEKAARDFSAEATSRRQLAVYNEVLRRAALPRGGRDGVVLCGAYGRGNTGDEAILSAILLELRELDPFLPVTVLSRRPGETRRTHFAHTVHIFDIPRVLHALRGARLYLNGGGSLIQNVTSRRSLYYYLFTLRAAKRRGCRVLMYGCGLGPVTGERDRRAVRETLTRYVDAITLREPDSLRELEAFGAQVPSVALSSDPALRLPAADAAQVRAVLERCGVPDGEAHVCFALRPWPGFEEKAAAFAETAGRLYAERGLVPLFLTVNRLQDGPAIRAVTGQLSCPFRVIDAALSPGEVIGILGSAAAVVSMRLHGLIFAAGQGVPLVGVSYDPKVSAFLDYVEQPACIGLDAVTADGLCALLEQAMAADADTLAQATAQLRAAEGKNLAAARALYQ